ncbi:MAG TPA: aldolase [Gaiellales bacterium]|jgi:ribulose-5-phosphate 4-epimerase/fuculose-1-phosphate aldolase
MTTTPAIDPVTQAKVDLAAALRAAALHGLNEGVDNHFSLAVPRRDDRFLLNRFGPHWSEITASDLITVDLDGEVVEGEGEWELTAFMIHRGVHLARPSARCVLHTHMPYATAVSMTQGGFDTRVSQNSMMFHGRVVSLAYGGFAEAADEGNRIGEAVGDDVSVVMLENHGVLVIGETVAEAWHRLYFLERACQMQVLAQSTGRPLIQVSEELAARTAAQAVADTDNPPALFAAVRRQLDRESPGYQF